MGELESLLDSQVLLVNCTGGAEKSYVNGGKHNSLIDFMYGIQVFTLDGRVEVELEQYVSSAKSVCRFYDPSPIDLDIKGKLESAMSKVNFTKRSIGL